MSHTGCPEKTECYESLKNIMLIYATVKACLSTKFFFKSVKIAKIGEKL